MAMDREAWKRMVEQTKLKNGCSTKNRRLLYQTLKKHKYVTITVLVARVQQYSGARLQVSVRVVE